MYERFSGCRVLSYYVMTNHFHLLLEVPPPPSNSDFGISEEELVHRLGGLYSKAYITGVQAEIPEAQMISEGKRDHFSRLSPVDQKKLTEKSSLPRFSLATPSGCTVSANSCGGSYKVTLVWFNKKHGIQKILAA